jgi:hypothetical protein
MARIATGIRLVFAAGSFTVMVVAHVCGCHRDHDDPS